MNTLSMYMYITTNNGGSSTVHTSGNIAYSHVHTTNNGGSSTVHTSGNIAYSHVHTTNNGGSRKKIHTTYFPVIKLPLSLVPQPLSLIPFGLQI